MTSTPLRLGLPAWAFPGWQGRYWPARPSPLSGYAKVFNAVEGNTTFYRIPDAPTVASWARAVGDEDFRFCFKLPRTVTHERQPALDDLTQFLRVLDPLGDKLGPFLVQFPARVGPADFDGIAHLLDRLPGGSSHVLEVRHPAFFRNPETLEALMQRSGGSRAILDSRALYNGDLEHADVVGALHEKPDLPVLPRSENGRLFLRLVLHPDAIYNDRYLDEWARRTAVMLEDDVEVFAMIHCPNNLHCPPFARDFFERLAAQPGGRTLPS